VAANLSRSRLRKAFNEGRRAATEESAVNPYDNPKLRELWEQGRTQQRAGQITAPIPPLEHGERRAERHPQNPPRPKPLVTRPPRRGDFRGPGRRRGR
jgi:hypothetical protein